MNFFAIVTIIVILVLGFAVSNYGFSFTEEQKAEDKQITEKRNVERIRLFNVCMELAAKMPRQADDDVSDIVEECTSSSYYMSNYIH